MNSAGVFLQDACVVHKITGNNATLFGISELLSPNIPGFHDQYLIDGI